MSREDAPSKYVKIPPVMRRDDYEPQSYGLREVGKTSCKGYSFIIFVIASVWFFLSLIVSATKADVKACDKNLLIDRFIVTNLFCEVKE